jgi:hypothetical protein
VVAVAAVLFFKASYSMVKSIRWSLSKHKPNSIGYLKQNSIVENIQVVFLKVYTMNRAHNSAGERKYFGVNAVFHWILFMELQAK